MDVFKLEEGLLLVKLNSGVDEAFVESLVLDFLDDVNCSAADCVLEVGEELKIEEKLRVLVGHTVVVVVLVMTMANERLMKRKTLVKE